MRKDLSTLVFIFLYFSSFGHIEIFNLSEGSIKPNQSFEKHYSVEIDLHKNLFIDEFGIDFFNVGEDDLAHLRIEIYKNHKLVLSTSTTINSVYNQIAYIKLNYLLLDNQSYVFQVIDEDLEKFNNSDNTLGLFTPKKLPSIEINNIFNTTKIGSSKTTNYPFNIALDCPFIHLGTTTQVGISLSAIENKDEFNKLTNSFDKGTSFKLYNSNQPLQLDSIGLNYIDSGDDNTSTLKFQLVDSTSNETVWKLDTIIYNKRKVSISFPVNITLENKSYILSLAMNELNNNDDNIILYKPKILPYIDNLKKITVTSLLTKTDLNLFEIEDTIGVPFTMYYKEGLVKTNNILETNFYITNTTNKLIIQNNQFVEMEIYDLNGKNIFKHKNSDNSDKIEIETTSFQNGLYILRILNENGNLSDYMLHKY
jgi:hypothetical protein